MPTPVRRPGRERYESILDAALECFAERGVANAGVEEIRRRAGASPSSVYHLFSGVAGIRVALLERVFEQLFAASLEAVLPCATASETVRALVREHVRWVVAQPDAARFMYEATALKLDPEDSARVLAHKQRLLAPLAAKLAGYATTGELPAWPIEVLDVVLLGATHEACRRWLVGADLSVEWMLEHLPDAACRTVNLQ